MSRLNPDDLVVTSFEVDPSYAIDRQQPEIITTTNDPTAATRCFICPQETYRSCDLICPIEPYPY